MKRVKRLKRMSVLLLFILSAGLLSGCGGGGGGGAAATNPANGSTWDQMVWDQGKWA
jgi:hypothetical protein